MIAAVALLSLAAPAPGVSAPVPLLTVPDLAQRHGALTGRTVRVRGRLAECQPLSCGLLDDERLAAPIAWLSFEYAPAVDAAAHGAIGRRVVVEGIVLAHCWPGDREASGRPRPPCFDRATQFRPLRIVRVLPDSAGGEDGR
ncbi:hypothetical protein [uncultured Sphingomonas sp.]|uniref:hypothetical protein n=1 Tax=uncultured Sphingomonas sp. TaxID=158754 RepID=UPI0035C9F21B